MAAGFIQDMIEQILANLNRYVSLTKEEEDIISTLFTKRKFKRRQYVIQQGDIVKFATFIISGITRTYETDDKGVEYIISFGMEDDCICDLYGFLTEKPARYTTECLEDTDVWQLSKSNLDILYQRIPKMERHFRIVYQNAFIDLSERLAGSLTKTATERYTEFVERYPILDQRVPDYHIASYLGITPQSLSRIRAQLKKES